MIVIACYNNPIVIDTFLKSMTATNNLTEPVLVVCTDPNQKIMLDYLKSNIENFKKHFNIEISCTPYAGFDTGAFIWAYKNYKDDYYIFLQESLVVNDRGWFEVFKGHRAQNVLNAWCTFDLSWDDQIQRQTILSKIPDHHMTLDGLPIGIFGNMFQISRDNLITIDKKYELNNFIPTDKLYGSCAMERGWAYLAKHCSIEIDTVDGKYSPHEHDYNNKLFQKIFYSRRYL